MVKCQSRDDEMDHLSLPTPGIDILIWERRLQLICFPAVT